jgi:hypothetical protein
MNYKFGEYIKKQESDFLKTKVNSGDLIRISDANNYYNSYKKQFSSSSVVKRFIKNKWLKGLGLAIVFMIILTLINKHLFTIPDFTCGWISCIGFYLGKEGL